ncbi:Rieske 2Fe-2S domain-containing protein [Nocardia sp. NPDC058658]|uniref:Rieske 2Fe-2S domain-containing protein n=1 Tax=Nocardia sp. NPDC058658 TaxID=3346580 RepID=UPI0036576549
MNNTDEQWFDNSIEGLENFWHPVAFAHEVTADAPTRVELLGRRWVVIRTGDDIVAFRDECPHRRASLSKGQLVEGTIECPYHGWRYNLQGQCVLVPALPQGSPPPARARLAAAHSVTEHLGLIWMAIEEPVVGLIDWPQWNTAGWDTWWLERRSTHVNGGLLTENFMDTTHFAFVHRNSFGAESPSSGVEFSDRDGWRMRCTYPHVSYQPGLGTVTAQVDTLLQGPFNFWLHLESAGGSRVFTFFLQPVSATETRLFLGVGTDTTHGDQAAIDVETKFNNLVYDEDLEVLEDFAEQRLPLGLRAEISTAADANLIKYRRMLADIARLTRETAPPVTQSV